MIKKILLYIFFMSTMINLFPVTRVHKLSQVIYPRNLIISGDRMYITDYPKILLYSLSDLKFIKMFGKEGRGPGDFFIDKEAVDRKERGLLITVNSRHIVIKSYLWVSLFSRMGKFLKTIRFQRPFFQHRFFACGDNYLTSVGTRGKDGLRYDTIHLFDSNLKPLKEICRFKSYFQMKTKNGKAIYNDGYDFFARAGAIIFKVYQDKVFVFKGGAQRFEIMVFNQHGDKIYTIQQNHEKIRVTDLFKKRVHRYYITKFKRGLKWNLEHTRYPEFFPPIHDFIVADQKIYVLSFKRERGENEVIILDLKGKLLKQLMIPVAERNPEHFHALTINKNKLYQLVEDEAVEEWNLHISEIK